MALMILILIIAHTQALRAAPRVLIAYRREDGTYDA